MSAVPVHCDLNPAPVEQFAPRGGVFLSPEPRTIPSWVEEGACSLSLRIRSWLNNAPEPPLARLRQGSPTNGLDGFPPEGGGSSWANRCRFPGEDSSSYGPPMGLRREEEGGKAMKTALSARDRVSEYPLSPCGPLTRCGGRSILRMEIIGNLIIRKDTV